jgi:magnesium-transporting ATPase (P-type)
MRNKTCTYPSCNRWLRTGRKYCYEHRGTRNGGRDRDMAGWMVMGTLNFILLLIGRPISLIFLNSKNKNNSEELKKFGDSLGVIAFFMVLFGTMCISSLLVFILGRISLNDFFWNFVIWGGLWIILFLMFRSYRKEFDEFQKPVNSWER